MKDHLRRGANLKLIASNLSDRKAKRAVASLPHLKTSLAHAREEIPQLQSLGIFLTRAQVLYFIVLAPDDEKKDCIQSPRKGGRVRWCVLKVLRVAKYINYTDVRGKRGRRGFPRKFVS